MKAMLNRVGFTFYCLCLAIHAHAETPTFNRVDFQIEVGREISNDLLVAHLNVEVQDKHPAQVAQQINAVMNLALKKASAFSAVKSSNGGQSTYPVYGKTNKLEWWRGNAQLRIESRDFKEAGELIGQLQSAMQIGGVSFTVAPETRQQAENALVSEAIAAFAKRAEVIRVAMGGSGYKVIQLAISNAGNSYQRPMMVRHMMAEAVSTPDYTGGDSRISVQISGSIEVEKPK